MKSLYIHIPFCKHKCFYCDFNSFSGADSLIDDYVKAIKREISIIAKEEKSFKTIYIGGGTPSFIDEKYIKEILGLVKSDGEITIEVNPGTVTREELISYKSLGINRLSIGLQTTNDYLLKRIGRIHSLKDFEETYKIAREIGFNNINVDLMFGLPEQKLVDVEESLNYLIKLNPEHISCYSLIVHDENVAKFPGVFSNLPSEDEERQMYYLICNKLKENGYVQYEISNFSKIGFESKHNLCYWNQEEYYGVGAGASSYINGKRYTNESNLKEYIKRISEIEDETIEQVISHVANIEEIQTIEDKIKEYMILRLRLLDGVSANDFHNKFGGNVLNYFKNEIEKLIQEGLLVKESSNDDILIHLSTKGLDLANIVWEEFI